MEGGIERALLDAQHVARNLLDALGYGPAMLRFQRKGLQDEQIQRSLWKVDTVRVGHALPFRFYKEHTDLLSKWKGNSFDPILSGSIKKGLESAKLALQKSINEDLP